MKTRIKRSGHAALPLALFLLLGNPLPADAIAQEGGGAAAQAAENAGNQGMQAVSGRVVQTMNSGGYTYALVEGGGGATWVALPKSQIAVGNEITCQGMMMHNFSSPSLGRTFKQIVFSSGITSLAAGTASPDAAPAEEEAIVVPKIPEPEDWKEF